MDFPKPSVYVPLLRRFGGERDRDLGEARRLYDWVRQAHDAFPLEPLHLIQRVYREMGEISDPVLRHLAWAMKEVVEAERYIWELPPPAFDRMNLKEFVDYRNLLYAKEYFYKNEGPVLDLLHDGLCRIFLSLAEELPQAEEPSPFSIPMAYAMAEPALTIERIYGTLVEPQYQDRGLFKETGERLYRNLCRASGREPFEDSRRPWKNVSDSDLPLPQLIDTYLAGSPFRDLFTATVPLKLTREDRMSHMHVVGGTGAGKTTLIKNLILYDLASPEPPAIVLIDPHSDLIKELVRADLGIEDRLIYIDPRDTKHPVALNPFALNRDRLRSYDEPTREQVTAGVIQTFDYLFSGLTDLKLTGKQETFFRYVTRLLLMLPEAGVLEDGQIVRRNATILDMLKLIGDPAPYQPSIEALPDIPREFFRTDFRTKTFDQTKEQIRYRLQAIIENPTIARLFTAPETKVDLFTELNRGSVILVDTAKDFLKSASSTFSRIFISLVLQAVLERAAIPSSRRKDAFVYIDESASVFDDNIDDFLTDARKYRTGLILAHQYLQQATSSLQSSLAANTAIKFASGLSAGDARSMAPEMRTTSDFILSQPRLQFAAHIRNVTPHAVAIPIEPPRALPMLSDDAFAALLERNRRRVSLGAPAPGPTRSDGAFTAVPVTGITPAYTRPISPAPPASDISPEW